MCCTMLYHCQQTSLSISVSLSQTLLLSLTNWITFFSTHSILRFSLDCNSCFYYFHLIFLDERQMNGQTGGQTFEVRNSLLELLITAKNSEDPDEIFEDNMVLQDQSCIQQKLISSLFLGYQYIQEEHLLILSTNNWMRAV